MKKIAFIASLFASLSSIAQSFPCRKFAVESAKLSCETEFGSCSNAKSKRIGISKPLNLVKYKVDLEWENGEGYGNVIYDVQVKYELQSNKKYACTLVEFI